MAELKINPRRPWIRQCKENGDRTIVGELDVFAKLENARAYDDTRLAMSAATERTPVQNDFAIYWPEDSGVSNEDSNRLERRDIQMVAGVPEQQSGPGESGSIKEGSKASDAGALSAEQLGHGDDVLARSPYRQDHLATDPGQVRKIIGTWSDNIVDWQGSSSPKSSNREEEIEI